MRPFRVSRSLIAVFILASFVPPFVSFAQTPFSISGIPPYAVQIPVPLGFVSATTGRLHLEIPFASIPERNGEPLIAKLVFDGTSFYRGSAWMLVTGTAHKGSGSYNSNNESCTAAGESGYPNGNVSTFFGFSFTDFNNTVHASSTNENVYTKQYNCYSTQGVPDPNNSYGTPNATASAGDGSGYTFWVSNYTAMQIYAPDGTLVYDTTSTGYGLETPVDTNGNYENAAQVNSAPDTLGRTPFTISSPTSGCLGNGTAPATLTVKASDGSAQTYTFNCTMLNVSEVIYGNTVVVTDSFLTSITLPDNTQYSFTYDTGSTPTHVGNLLSVTLPTGGQVSFTYEPNTFFLNSCQTCTGGVAASATFGGGTWNLSYTNNSSDLSTTTTLTAPPRYDSATNSYISDVTVFNSVPNNNPFLQNVQYYSGSSTPLKAVNFAYDLYFLPLSVTTTLGGVQSTVSYQYLNGMRDYITQKQETDFSGNVVRTTTASYTGNRPTQINVYPGPPTGSPIASTLFAYDEYSANYCKNGVPMLTNITGATNHDDAGHGISWTARGNVTTIQRLISGSTYATTHMCYDTLGKVTQVVDPNGNPTTNDYSEGWTDTSCIPSGTITHAFPTTITDALGHQTKKSYFTCTSLPQGTKDANDIHANRNGTTFTYDLLGRPLVTSYPDGGQTTYCYSHDPNLSCYTTTLPPFITESRLMSGSTTFNTKTLLDAYGRVAETQIASDPDCSSGDKTDTSYDSFGRVYTVSNPYCTTSDPTYGLTTYAYDALGRTTQVTHPDNTTILTTYTGHATQIQDEGNGTKPVTRILQTDALGRLLSLCEVSGGSLVGSGGTPAACGQDIAGTGFLTSYQYDSLDNLLQVNQTGIASRTFTYDSLSRLLTAYNPESGTITYTYDADSNVITKTDARGITTCFGDWTGSSCNGATGYDALNRLLKKTYSDGTPAANFNYDESSARGVTLTNTIGRKSSESTAGSSPTGAVFSYDPMGRIADNSQCAPQNCGSGIFAMQYPQYDFLGDLISATNAAGVTFTYSYNTADRLTGITTNFVDASHPGTLFSGAHYNPAGALLSASLGNVISETRTYDSRLRLASIADGSNYSLTIPSSGGYAPNGDILAANDSINGNWTYSYDDFNRLSGSNQNGGQAVYSYVYDRFGNRWQQNGPNSMQLTFTGNNPGNPQNNNRMDGYSYDSAGNLLNDGVHSYAYDAENHIIQVDGGSTASYVYNAEGQRVRKTASGSTLDYLYDLDGHKVADVDPTGVFLQGELYAGGRHFAIYAPDPGPTGATFFTLGDWLGTERVRTDMTGAVCETITSLPFGDGQSISDSCGDSNGDVSPLHFTGKERDSESGLDNFDTRYLASSLGRFMSADQLGRGQHPENPQTWNLYSYVLNNPLKLVDPSGEFTCDAKTVSDQQCDDFQKVLDKAQDAADALGNKYGWDSKQYLDAQRAIDAYGDEGVNNGVTIAQGNVGAEAADVAVAGNTVAKTADNPNGQNIWVTFDKRSNVLGSDVNGLAALAAHEGVHVADASDWVSSGFSPNAHPSVFQTEWDAHQVQGGILEGLGARVVTFQTPVRSYSMFLPMSPTSSTLTRVIKSQYPEYNMDAFSRNTKLPRPQP